MQHSNSIPQALILGATGGFGFEVTRQLLLAGWQVRALHRQATQQSHSHGNRALEGVQWLVGDALCPSDVARAAKGCQIIVHAVNPPGYRHWNEQVLPMLDHTIAAARQEQATIVLPGSIYNYHPDQATLLREDTPQSSCTTKGKIRIEMENRLLAASQRGAKVLILRMGDFFGAQARSSWFSQAMIKPQRLVKTIALPGKPGVGHQWTYLPDAAQTVLALLDRREQLPAYATFHMAGHWDPNGLQFANTICQIARRYDLHPRLSSFPWWLLRCLAPVAPTLRELLTMRYLWEHPLQLDGQRLTEFLGQEPHTPLEIALETTLQGLGCLPLSPEQAIPTTTAA